MGLTTLVNYTQNGDINKHILLGQIYKPDRVDTYPWYMIWFMHRFMRLIKSYLH